MPELDNELQENYRAVHEAGESWESIAARLDTVDPNVAGWLREQAKADAPSKAKSGGKRTAEQG